MSIAFEFRGLTRKLAVKYVAPGVDLEDLEQEAILAAIVACNEEGPFITSLKNRVCFTVRDVLRKYRRANRTDRVGGIDVVSLDEGVGCADDGEEMTRHEVVGAPQTQERDLERTRNEDVPRRIAESVKKIFRLEAEGYTHAEIAALVGKSPEAVQKAAYRARQVIQKGAA